MSKAVTFTQELQEVDKNNDLSTSYSSSNSDTYTEESYGVSVLSRGESLIVPFGDISTITWFNIIGTDYQLKWEDTNTSYDQTYTSCNYFGGECNLSASDITWTVTNNNVEDVRIIYEVCGS